MRQRLTSSVNLLRNNLLINPCKPKQSHWKKQAVSQKPFWIIYPAIKNCFPFTDLDRR